MNYKRIVKIIVALGMLFMSTSCLTTKTVEKNPNYLGDYEPIQLGELVCLQEGLTGSMKPLEVRLYFIPRSNAVEFYYHSDINFYGASLNPKNRMSLFSGIDEYASVYKDDLKDVKPSDENAFSSGSISISWGVAGLTRDGDADFRCNYEYKNGKPYFKLTIKGADDKMDSSVRSIWQYIYFSPAQLEKFMSLTNQNYLQSLVDEKEKEAFAYENFEGSSSNVKESEGF